MHSVTVSGETVAALKTNLAAHLAALNGAAAVEATDAKRSVGRPKSAEKTPEDLRAEMGLEPAVEAPKTPAPAPKAKTEADVKAALNECMAARTGDPDEMAGMGRVKAVLKSFGVQKISELKAAQYADVVEAAQKS
jgi:hypothetical protein